jgi:hypothetical protein
MEPAMSCYSTAERHEIMRQARAHVAECKTAAPANRSSATGLVYKENPNARVFEEPTVVRSDDIFTEAEFGVLAELIVELRQEMRAHVEAEVGKLAAEFALLQKEVALERGFQALKAEIAAARADVPKVPEIEARVDARQSELAAEQKRLERELAKTKDRLGKVQVNQSVSDFELQKHIKQSKPAVELHFETSASSFVVRDLHPDAAAAWRDFCSDLMADQQNAPLLRVIDPTSPTGLAIGLPVRSRGYGA